MVKIPEKLYFKIGEVAKLVGVEPYVLRYWETEFKEIEPIKSRSGQRLYRHKDVQTILMVKELLYTEGYTIEGARRKVRDYMRQARVEGAVTEGENKPKSVQRKLEEAAKILS